LVGDFDGALLVKNFRPDAPPDEELEKLWRNSSGSAVRGRITTKAEEKLIEKYGQEEAEGMMFLS